MIGKRSNKQLFEKKSEISFVDLNFVVHTSNETLSSALINDPIIAWEEIWSCNPFFNENFICFASCKIFF